MPRFPIRVKVKQRTYGTNRSIDILYENSEEEFTQTRDWRLEAISISGDLRERLEINEWQETQVIGHIDVDPETFDWAFVPSED